MDLPPPGQTMDKKNLRKSVSHHLSSLSKDEVLQQSRDAYGALLQTPEYKNSRSISIFMSMPSSEIQTEMVVRHAFETGKEIYIPYIYKRAEADGDLPASIMDMLRLNSMEDYESLTPDKWGIPSIDKNSIDSRRNCFGTKGLTQGEVDASADAGLDLIITPAVAFDHKMNRLGHGKGYYDNFLTRYIKAFSVADPSKRKPYLIGYALKDQILPREYRLPVESWDQPVDMIICGGHVVVPRSTT